MLTLKEKQELVDRSKPDKIAAKTDGKGIIVKGCLSGSQLAFPMFCGPMGIHFEISWDLAQKAVNNGVVIRI